MKKGQVKIYEGKAYVAIPEIEEESCTGCCFYDKGICSIDHANDPNCLHSGMIWTQKEDSISDIKEKAIKLAIEAMRPIPVYSSFSAFTLASYSSAHALAALAGSEKSGMHKQCFRLSSNSFKALSSFSFSIKYLLAIFPLSLFYTMHSSLAISINSR